MTDPETSPRAEVPFTSLMLIGRWPQMVPRSHRLCWKTDKRSFTFLWEIPPETLPDPIHIILRNVAAVFEVMDGGIEIGDGISSLAATPSRPVAVSRGECWIHPGWGPATGHRIAVSLIGAIPGRSRLFLGEDTSGTFRSQRGIIDIGEDSHGRWGLCRNDQRNRDPGEALMARYLNRPGFLRFLASIPEALYRPEGKKGKNPGGSR